jgi:hypothetical protein
LDVTRDLAVAGVATSGMSVVDESGSTQTVDSNDRGLLLRYTHASGCAVTLPATLPVGFTFSGCADNGDQVISFSVSGSGTIIGTKDATLGADGDAFTAVVVANAGGSAARWLLKGDLE